MPAVFDKSGIAFAYPDNWVIEEDASNDPYPQVTVASPRTAFWSLCAYPSGTNGEQLVEEAVEALRADYPELDVESVTESIELRLLDGVDVRFLYLNLIVRARIQVFDDRGRTYFLLCQAEDDEFEAMSPVFLAMTTSLLRGDASLAP
jgi:hypothetical protein